MQDSLSDVSFEEALKELESIVRKMEQGDLPLDQSLAAFERGVQLTRHCQQALQSAQQKVQVLLVDDEKAELSPFIPSDIRKED